MFVLIFLSGCEDQIPISSLSIRSGSEVRDEILYNIELKFPKIKLKNHYRSYTKNQIINGVASFTGRYNNGEIGIHSINHNLIKIYVYNNSDEEIDPVFIRLLDMLKTFLQNSNIKYELSENGIRVN